MSGGNLALYVGEKKEEEGDVPNTRSYDFSMCGIKARSSLGIQIAAGNC
jgi:hypothetical protein